MIREVGLLFFVFGPLDTVFIPSRERQPRDWIVASLIAALGILLVQKGVEVECGDERSNDNPPVGGVRSGVLVDDSQSKSGKSGESPGKRGIGSLVRKTDEKS